MENDEPFKTRLAAAMESSGITAVTLALALKKKGIGTGSFRTVQGWRYGRHAPQKYVQDMALAICAKMGGESSSKA